MTIVPLLVGLTSFVGAALLLGRRRVPDPGRRIAQLVEPRTAPAGPVPQARLGRLAQHALEASDPWLARAPGWSSFVALLERAGVTRSPVELAWLLAAGTAAVTLLLLVAGAAPMTVAIIDLVVVACTRMTLALRASRRTRAFEEHLPDVLTELASALRAGHGFLQALQAVAADAPSPVGPELQRVLAEARLGRPLEDALTDAGTRLRSEDFDFVLGAVMVQRQVGGSLAGIFEIVGETVRSRQQFALKLRALTSMGRLSAGVLLALPLLVALVLTLLNSAYMAPLVTTGVGRALLVVTLVLLVTGSVWLSRITAGCGK